MPEPCTLHALCALITPVTLFYDLGMVCAQLLRNFWLHVALHRAALIGPLADPAWRAAAGHVAAATPVLLVGLDAANPQDALERLKVSSMGPVIPLRHRTYHELLLIVCTRKRCQY